MLAQGIAAAKPPTRAKSNQDLAAIAAAANANATANTNTSNANANTNASSAAAGGSKKPGGTGSAAPATTTTAPISIGQSKAAKAEAAKNEGKKAPQMAFSAPVSRPPPPRAPTQRPRVPSIDPPPMALPPSPVIEAPVMNIQPTPAPAGNVSAPVAVGGSAVKPAPKKSAPISRSLTIYSSSVPNVSYMNQTGAAGLYPSFAPVTEGQPVDEPTALGGGVLQPNSATSTYRRFCGTRDRTVPYRGVSGSDIRLCFAAVIILCRHPL